MIPGFMFVRNSWTFYLRSSILSTPRSGKLSLAFWVSNYVVVCRFSVDRAHLLFSAVIDVKVIDFKIHT